MRLREATDLLRALASSQVADPRPLDPQWRENIKLRTADHARYDDRLDLNRTLPVEATQHEYAVADALWGLYQLTRSRSVSLRLLTVNGRYLVRTCRFPVPARGVADQPDDDGYVFDVDRDWKTSANSWVARTGKPCDVPDVRQAFAEQHPGLESIVRARGRRDPLRSLYCSPVFSSGRLMGTVNVESVYPGAYATTRMFVNAVAAQIGQLLELGRDENERLLSVSSPMGSLKHHAERLRQMVMELIPTPEDNRYGEILRSLTVVTRQVESSPPDSAERPNRRLREVIVEVIDRMELTDACTLSDDRGLFECQPFAEAGASASFQIALGEVLSNARKQYPRVPGGHIRITCKDRQRGGVLYIEVIVGNPFEAHSGNQSVIRNLDEYGRRPLGGADRPHWGALLAGATVRRHLDGELFLRRYGTNIRKQAATSPPYFQVVIEIPKGEGP